jgi:transcriptional regulator with AAA-type ATPase domain
MGIGPDAATRQAYERLMQQEASAVHSEVQQRRQPPLSVAAPKLIGRAREWEELHATWQRTVQEGYPSFVLVTGEAGVGKSRLAEDFLLWASQQGAVVDHPESRR